MKVDAVIRYVRNMRDREGLDRLMNACESRSLLLSNLDGERRKAQLWEKFKHLQKGDMVFIHQGKTSAVKAGAAFDGFTSKAHRDLYGVPLTVKVVKHRIKEIVVRRPGSTQNYPLSPFQCASLKLSTTPTAEAFGHSLKDK